ncbi:MAG: hypothetical protein ACOY45_04575 [Pseudomonadota bacterium]
MRNITLIGSEPVVLAPPSPQEILIAERFVNDPKQLATLRHQIAYNTALIAVDPQALPEVVEHLFRQCNESFEAELQNTLPNYNKWSPNLGQPRPFARLAILLPSVRRFVRKGFGRLPDVDDSLENSKLNKEENTIQNLLYGAFWSEINAVSESELVLNLESALRMLWENSFDYHVRKINYDEWRRKLDVNNPPTDTFLHIYSSGASAQFIVSLNYSNRDKFISEYKRGDRWISWNTIKGDRVIIGSVDRRESITNRMKFHREYIRRVTDDFQDQWNAADFLLSIGLNQKGRYYRPDIENATLKNIVKLDLDNKGTEESSAASNPVEQRDELSSHVSLGVRERLAQIDDFTKNHPGEPVSGLILELFPELVDRSTLEKVALPIAAPQKWSTDRILIDDMLENPYQFIKRVYEPWLGKGLTKAHVRKLDDPLMQAFYLWQREHPMPEDLDLPTKKEWVDREVAAMKTAGGGWATTEQEREARRLMAASRRRSKN